jgi:cytochrome c55X
MKGGLGPPLVPVVIAEKPEEALIDAILNGRPGTPMPPWAFALSEAEAAWLVDRLRRGTTE